MGAAPCPDTHCLSSDPTLNSEEPKFGVCALQSEAAMKCLRALRNPTSCWRNHSHLLPSWRRDALIHSWPYPAHCPSNPFPSGVGIYGSVAWEQPTLPFFQGPQPAPLKGSGTHFVDTAGRGPMFH